MLQVKADARQLAKKINKDNPDNELFDKAAEVARDPPNFETVKGLTDFEKAVLRNEKTTKPWQQPKAMRIGWALLCLSALVQGWAESIANVANLTWPAFFGLDIEKSTADRFVFAGVNSVTWFSAGILGCGLADPLQSWLPWLGRRGMIFVATCLCLVGAIGSSTSSTWQMLMAFRVVLGTGLGAKACTTPIYAAEIAPSHLRGVVVMCWQLFVALGIACGFASSLIVYEVGPKEDAWRWQTASIVLALISLMTLTATCPESPRYLLKHGNYAAAYQSLCDLHDAPVQAARDLVYINAQIQVETTILPKRSSKKLDTDAESPGRRPTQGQFALQSQIQHLTYWDRLTSIFMDGRTRRALQAACIVMITQQLCGINGIIFYSSNILDFKQPNLDGNIPLILNLGIGLANFAFTIPAYLAIDSKGRRFLLLTMYPIMALTMLAAGLSFLEADPTTRAGLVITFIFLFVMAYSVGQGPVAFTYASEVFPLVYRELAFGFAVAVNLSALGLLSFVVPFVQIPGSVKGTSYTTAQCILLAAFSVLNVIAGILCFFFVPETAGTVISRKQGKINSMSLEELNYIFGVKTLRHASYQLRHWAPYAFKYVLYIVCHIFTEKVQKPTEPEVLWTWAQLKENEKASNESAEDTESGNESEKRSAHASEVEDTEQEAQERRSRAVDLEV